ncbi:zinc finger protein OZF-like, partial [Adelges cooleyi]|uniref:zinc finger protein OZF-like n=1 Tax=Adelges cooleyi TaxID=133065 RepID=UPI00217F9C38
MLKIKQENDDTEEHSHEGSFEVIETKPLDVQFKTNEISITEEYLVKNEDDNTYKVLKRLKIKHENVETEVIEPQPLDVQFISNEVFTAEEYLVKNEGDNTNDIHFPCKATDTTNNIIKTNSEENIHKIRRFDCNICHRRYSTKSHIIRHIAKSHSTTSMEKKVPQKNEVNHRNSRIKGYTRNKVDLLNCGICLKTFSSKSSLRTHWRIHTDEKPFKCDVCAKTFSQKTNLETHARIHTGEKPFKCNVCAKTFSQRVYLNNHKRIHTGEKPFRCNFCEKTFGEQSTLKIHERMHTGEKPFNCNVCAKTFRQRAHLNNHKRIHTGEKPFKCDVCEKAFADRSTHKSHKRIHTGEKL